MTDHHMTIDEFVRHGHAVLDLVADYLRDIESRPIIPDLEPGEIRKRLPEDPPQAPEPFDVILQDVETLIMPGLVQWQSPGWFAFFPANTSPPSILGELLAAGFGQQGMLWSTSPATTELEAHVLDWMVDLLGLPPEWKTTGPGGGVIQMSASDATHTALVVARTVARARARADQQVVYTSAQAHSSIEKGAKLAGFEHIRLIDVDHTSAMRTEALEAAIEADRAAGLTPAFVCSAIGTTGTTAVDPIRPIAELARRHAMWHHVDAAYAGSAMILPELRSLQDGVEMADSYVFNPHKWMFTNFDCSIFYVADRAPLIDAMSIVPPYLRNRASERDDVIDYRDWHVPLGRRFRALKLWMVLRSYGTEGLRHHIREHIDLAKGLSRRVAAHPRLELIAPTPFALVSLRHVDGNEATDALAESINRSGHSYVTRSSIDDRAYIRIAISQTRTTASHVERLWKLIDDHA